MKKAHILFILIHILLVSYSYSQENKFIIGGNFGFNFSQNKFTDSNHNSQLYAPQGTNLIPAPILATNENNASDFKSYIAELNPEIGYFVSPRFVLGIGLEFLFNRNNYDSELIYKTSSIGLLITPFVRYYLIDGFYTQLQLNYGISNEKIDGVLADIPQTTGFSRIDYNSKMEYVVIGGQLGFGYTISLGEKIALEPSLKYMFNKLNGDYENPGNLGDYKINQNHLLLGVGLKYLIKR